MSALQELDAALQPMLLLKPPGVSGSKIKDITALCLANVKSESVIIQKIYTHFKKAPGTHKLGVLYVVDSVTRQWVDHARKAGQTIGNAADDGTFAAGVNRVTELLPVLMTDLIQQAPEDQKDKIKKLVDIWERGSTFPTPLLVSFKGKLNAPPNASSTTPPGTPPQGLPPKQGLQQQQQQQANAPAAGAPNTSAILAALANIAKQNTAATPAAPAQTPQPATTVPTQDNPYHVPSTQNAYPPPVSSSVNPAPAFPLTAHSVDVPVGGAGAVPPAFAGFSQNGAAAPVVPGAQANSLGALGSMLPQAGAGGAEALQQQLMLIQVLIQQGIPQDQWGPILAALSAGAAGSAMAGVNVVLSRTLFIGGVTCAEHDLRSVFSQFGNVQTCIVNQEKRHGFIKMISRKDALLAKEGMEQYKPPDMHLRTRWGVGFGPRDCSDYQTGISVIPIGRLTDADRKWMLTAEYGGSGGKPIEGGMIVEEPDIEIGAGVSSKAISRRMATDQGGKTGPRSTRTGGETGGRSRRHERHDGPGPARDSVNAIGVAPAVPGFGFQIHNLANGTPMMPTGASFPYPAGNGVQQPPSEQK
ncbi:MAG: hypothetical protein M1832_002559 [Thelocarpon impressellum]|nr:MAG: hypothetical protein M1832_002559 [Thelocarpon impressellum]